MSQQLGQTLEEWMQEREQRAQLLYARNVLVGLLRDRLGTIPEEVRRRIEETNDLDRLSGATFQVSRLQSLDELQL
jgi:hypothetical protein